MQDLVFPDRYTGYAVGYFGAILKLSRDPATSIAIPMPLVHSEILALRPDGSIRFRLAKSAQVTLQLFALDGRQVMELDGDLKAKSTALFRESSKSRRSPAQSAQMAMKLK